MNAVWSGLPYWRREYHLSNGISNVPRLYKTSSSGLEIQSSNSSSSPASISKAFKAKQHTNFSQATTITIIFTHFKQNPTTNTMAVFSMISNERPMLYGRSGYNSKPNGGDDDDKNQGRSGYNSKPNGDDDDKNHGRSGYNSKPDDDDKDNKRSLNFE